MKRRTLWGCIAILCVAAVTRLVVHFELRDYVLYRVPLVDAQDYVQWAARTALGQPEIADVYYKAPLYPWAVSLVMRILGTRVDAAYVLNALLGLSSIVLLWFWARRLFGAGIAWGAAALAAVYGPMLYFEAQALPPPLAIALSLVALLALTSANGAPRRAHWIIGGLALGLLVLTRPSFALCVLVAIVWLASRTVPGAWRRALGVTALVALVVAPVTLRNVARGGSWVLVSANGGINFFLGNNADAARTSALRPGLEWEELVRRIPDSERQGRARWDRWFAARAAQWIRDEPLGFVGGLATKTLQYLNTHEIDRNLDARGYRARSHVLRWAPRYACLAPWVLLGLVWAWRRGSVGRLAVWFAVASCVATVLFFVSERYRLDAAAVSLPCAVAGFAQCVQWLRRRPTSVPRRWIAACIALSVLVAYPNWLGIRDLHAAHAASLEGVALYAEGRNVEAIARLREAIAAEPTDADAHYQLATALRRMNRHAEALESFDAAARLVPGNPKPHAGAGLVLRQLGRPDEALQRYREALRQDPKNVLLHFESAEVYEGLGRPVEARAHYQAVLEVGGDAALEGEARRRLQRLREAGTSRNGR